MTRRTKSLALDRRTFLTLTAGFALIGAKRQAAGVEVEVLGTAQDAGLPHLGCSEDRCRRAFADPSLRKRIASIGIRAGDSLFLVDATPDIVSQITDLQLGRDRGRRPLDGILLTHAHIGHYLGLAFLGQESIAADRVPVYCMESMADYLSQNGPWSLLVSSEQVVLRPIGERKLRLADNLEVEALDVPHREEFTDTIGFIFTGPKTSLSTFQTSIVGKSSSRRSRSSRSGWIFSFWMVLFGIRVGSYRPEILPRSRTRRCRRR